MMRFRFNDDESRYYVYADDGVGELTIISTDLELDPLAARAIAAGVCQALLELGTCSCKEGPTWVIADTYDIPPNYGHGTFDAIFNFREGSCTVESVDAELYNGTEHSRPPRYPNPLVNDIVLEIPRPRRAPPPLPPRPTLAPNALKPLLGPPPPRTPLRSILTDWLRWRKGRL
ncbi:MAG: hypothetical protein HS113_04235 [Verrucomicrobiales bacterium]|nr:hypothetical protein [Verrucomicrobiales bacterium]